MDQSISPPPDGNTTVGPEYLGIVGATLGLGTVVYVIRMYTRVRPHCKPNSSDYTISVALVFEIVIYALVANATAEGLGRHQDYVDADAQSMISRLLLPTEILGPWVTTFARISIACMLLQFPVSTAWKVILQVAIAIQIVAGIGSTVVRLLQCLPEPANWEPVPGVHCWTQQQTAISVYTFGGAALVSDLVFAIMPMFCTWKLNRHRLERILISALMALGLCATAIVIVKIYLSAAPPPPANDMLREMATVQLWCRLEECCLLVAASVPCLKGPIERQLSQLGLPTFKYLERNLNSVHSLVHNDSNNGFSSSKGLSATDGEVSSQNSTRDMV